MSLLMDALRKAEEEKRRAALEKKGETTGGSEADHLASTYPPEGVSPGEQSSSNLSLEPIEGNTGDVGSQTGGNLSTTGAGSTTGSGSTTGPGSITGGGAATGAFGDTTRMRLTAAQKDVFDALGVPRRNEATGTFDTLRDPETTIPSKRMLKRSLEEYFESTRSIEGSKIEVALAAQAAAQAADAQGQGAPEPGPLPGASGPITAQTVFAAKRRSGSPLFSAAASLLLLAAAGLGAVGAYHWYTQSRQIRVVPPPSVAQTADSVESHADDSAFQMPPVAPVNPPAPVEATPPVTTPAAPTAQPPADAAVAVTTEPAPAPATPASPPVTPATPVSPTPADSVAAVAPATTSVEPTTPPPAAAQPAVEPVEPPAATPAPTAASDTPAPPVAMIEPPSRGEIETLQARPAERRPKSSLPAPKVSSGLDGSVMPGEIRITRSAAAQPFVPGQVQEAYEAYQRGDYNRAETLYRTTLARYPSNRDALLGLAALDWRRGDRAAAAATYNRLLQSNPADVAAKAGLLSLQKDRNPVADESSIKLMLQRDPESAPLRAALGSIYARQQRWPEAQQSYFEAVARDKNNPDLAFNLAVSLDNLGESAAALDYYRKAVELSGRTPARFAAADAQSRIKALAAGSSGSAP